MDSYTILTIYFFYSKVSPQLSPGPLHPSHHPFIPLHPSLALRQARIILLFYYSPAAAGADAALRSCLVSSAFSPFAPSLCFRRPRKKETSAEGAGGEGGKTPYLVYGASEKEQQRANKGTRDGEVNGVY